MGFKYAIRDRGLYFLTHTVVDWVDLFTRLELAQVITESLNYCIERKGLEVYVWCLMPSHLHMMTRIGDGAEQDLSGVMRDFKKYTSKRITERISEIDESRREWLIRHFERGPNLYQVWKPGMHPIACFKKKFTDQKMDYIHNNPVAAGIVEAPEHYLFSSAQDYYLNRKGLVNINYMQ